MVDATTAALALVAALAASRSIAVEPERIINVATWGVGDWFLAFIVVAWFLGDLTTGRRTLFAVSSSLWRCSLRSLRPASGTGGSRSSSASD
jgi:hypothetical protein